MQESEPAPVTSEIALAFKSDRVESPQQYSTWRDYAFSDEPEHDHQQGHQLPR